MRLVKKYQHPNGPLLASATTVIGKRKPSTIVYDPVSKLYLRSSTNEVVTPINTSISSKPEDWTYLDKEGRVYTPHREESNQGSITQGETPSTTDRILTFSNLHYNNPILGAPARFAEDWHNDRSPIKAVYNGPLGYSLAPLRFAHAYENNFGLNSFGLGLSNLMKGNLGSAILNTGLGILDATMGLEGSVKSLKYPILSFFTSTNPGKRVIETAMRSTSNPDPLPAIWKGMQLMPPERRKAILKYITTGKPTEGQVYDSWGVKGETDFDLDPNLLVLAKADAASPVRYNGSLSSPMTQLEFTPAKGYGDVIDAYLWGKPLDPRIARRVEGDPLGVHTSYVSRNYGKQPIPVYETAPEGELTISDREMEDILNHPNSQIKSSSQGVEGTMKTSTLNFEYDALGHNALIHRVNNPALGLTNTTYSKEQDIWKFNPDNYKDKYFWKSTDNLKEALKHQLLMFGLETVDKAGTPIILRSPWIVDNAKFTNPTSKSSEIHNYLKDFLKTHPDFLENIKLKLK